MKFPVLWLSFVSACVGGYRESDMHRMALLCKSCRKIDYDRVTYEMGSRQLITLYLDYNYFKQPSWSCLK